MIVLYTLCGFALAEPTVEDILSSIEANMTHDTRSSDLRMTVEGGRRTKVYEIKSYSKGKDEAAVVFTSPVRDKGTKMLKRGDALWMYLPTVEKTQKISGHMLRQGMMGSDLSYEDILQSTALTELYDAKISATEELNGRLCYRIEMTAKDDAVSYPKRVSWVDVELLVPVKEDLFALSGMLLKTWTMSEVEVIDGKNFPTKIVVEDKLQQGSVTTLDFVQVQFSVDFEDEVFSQRWLER